MAYRYLLYNMDKAPAKHAKAHWHCPNRNCGLSKAVPLAEEANGTHICDCGTLMRIVELPPAFGYLDFLRNGSELENAWGREEES